MLTGIHIILTYTCVFECDHCFLHCSPYAEGVFTIDRIEETLNEAVKIKTVEWIFFEGGEATLYYPLLLESVRRASLKGFKVGLVTNAYGANSYNDALLWLKPLKEAGLTEISLSNDAFHFGDKTENQATIAASAANDLGMHISSIKIELPIASQNFTHDGEKGAPVIGGGVKFRGRAVEKLLSGLPVKPWNDFRRCPYENLENPSRVHVDPYGHVHICQGVSMGNMFEVSLSKIVREYDAQLHPFCGPLIKGGPSELSRALRIIHEEEYVDECHFCYSIRKRAMDRFPAYLAPKQVYGVK